MQVKVYINEAPELFSRLPGSSGGYQAGDPLRLAVEYSVEGNGIYGALEGAFYLFNEGHPTQAEVARYRAAGNRSLSVGDVVVLVTPEGPEAHACASCGWDLVPRLGDELLSRIR